MARGKSSRLASAAENELVITRDFDAPRELVFKAWTEPERLLRWWAPKGCTTAVCRVDLRPGGAVHYCMRMPDGRDIWGLGVYREIVNPSLLVYTDAFADTNGNVVSPTYYGMSTDHPQETLVTVTFAEHADKTRLTLRHSIPRTVKEREGAEQGWTEMLERLADDLAQAPRRNVSLTRVFDAPRALVWKAWTDPKHMAQWWGPRGFTNPVCDMDVRPGGALRIVMHAPDGAEHPMTGVFREVVEPERLVFSMVAEDRDGKPQLRGLATVTFTEHGGKTRLTVQASAVGLVPISAQMLEGMEAGWTQSLERLADLVAQLRGARH